MDNTSIPLTKGAVPGGEPFLYSENVRLDDEAESLNSWIASKLEKLTAG